MREALLQNKLPRVPLAKQGRGPKQACRTSVCRETSKEEWREAEDLGLTSATWANLLSLSLSSGASISEKRPLTGKPDAGNPPVRFGGRGRVQSPAPTPIKTRRFFGGVGARDASWSAERQFRFGPGTRLTL